MAVLGAFMAIYKTVLVTMGPSYDLLQFLPVFLGNFGQQGFGTLPGKEVIFCEQDLVVHHVEL